MVNTCCAQEAVLLLLSCLADIDDAEEALIVGCEDVPLEGMLDGCHGGYWDTDNDTQHGVYLCIYLCNFVVNRKRVHINTPLSLQTENIMRINLPYVHVCIVYIYVFCLQ